MTTIDVFGFGLSESYCIHSMADNKHNEQRVSITGAIFSRNNSIPALGEAYSDPSNLLWGDVVKLQGAPNKLLQSEAIKYCELGGGRLPTREDFVKLATYLGYGTSAGYSPFSSDGKTEIIPGLNSRDLNPRSEFKIR